MALIFALISLFGWGIGDLFIAISSRKIGGTSTTLWSYIFGVMLFSLLLPSQISTLANLTLPVLFLMITLNLLMLSSYLSFLKALEIGNVGVVGTISASFSAVSVILSIIFFKEQISIFSAATITLIIIGTILSSYQTKLIKKRKNFNPRKAFIFSLFTMIIWGIYGAFVRIPIEQIGWFWPTFFTNLTFPILMLYMFFSKIKIAIPKKSSQLVPLIIGTVLVFSGGFAYNIAITKGLTAIVAPVSSSYPALLAILAYFKFKDPISRPQIIGIITCIIGIVTLSLST